MIDNPGYLYILINPNAEGLVKIGKTSRDPEERTKELSAATGVPTRFILVYKSFFRNCSAAESFVHVLLKDKRLSDNKEFFRIPVPEAIEAVIQAEKYFKNNMNGVTASGSDDLKPADESLESQDDTEELWQGIMDLADDLYYGNNDDVLQDYEKALNLYKQAAILGSVEAFHKIGDMYHDGEGVTQDNKQAVYYYKEAASRGDDICWGDMAICYYEIKEYGNVDKCWVKLFTSPSMKGNEKELARYFIEFMKFMYSESFWPHHNALKLFYQDLTKNMSEKELKHLIFGSLK